jgi:hypothetical protein
MMKHMIICLCILALSGNSFISVQSHWRRHRDLTPMYPRIADDAEKAAATVDALKTILLPTTSNSTSTNWASITVDKKEKTCCDGDSDGMHEVECSNRYEAVASCDAAFLTKIITLGLLAGAVLAE